MLNFIVILLFSVSSLMNWQEYTDNVNHFSLKYPESWEMRHRVGAIVFLTPKEDEHDKFQENVGLMLQDLSQQPMNLEGYTEITKKQIVTNLGESAIISLKSATLAGQQTKEFIYNMNYQGKSLRIKQYWFIKGNVAYLFTYTAELAEYSKY